VIIAMLTPLLLAELSYRLIEAPLLRRRPLQNRAMMRGMDWTVAVV
jgi:peptidoglycan/LPS O-acetylase OafA/YrhL